MKKILIAVACMAAFFGESLAQVTTPTPGVQYQILNSVGLALARYGDNCVIATPDKADKNQAWTFEQGSDAGYFYLKNVGTDSYMYLGTAQSWDTWDMSFSTSLPTNLTTGEYTLEALTAPYCGLRLKSNGKYLGTDATTDKSIVYGDKGTGNNGSWQLVVMSTWTDALRSLVSQVQKYEEDYLAEYTGLQGELDDVVLEYSTPANTDSATVKACMDTIYAQWDKVKQGYADATMLKRLVAKAENLLNTTSYPGMEALQTAYEAAADVSQNPEKLSADYAAAVTTFAAAIRTYQLSQEASADSPADYTFLIQHPWFCNDDNVPASNTEADIAAANQSASVTDGTGWVRGTTATSYGGLDEHASYRQSRDCWNAWGINFNGYLDVHQDLTDLPDGYYGITCDAITQTGCLNDQHVYAVSSIQSAKANLTTEGWLDDDATGKGTWESLNTATANKVLVQDGKLTLGFRGTHDASKMSDTAADGRNGWFCVTNFKLQYYGKASMDDLSAIYKATLGACQAQCDTMLFKGDKAVYQSVINAFKNATDKASINLAVDTLKKAASAASASIAKQVALLASCYKSINDSIASGVYSDATLLGLMQSAAARATALVNAEGQTSACADSVINSLNAYMNSYVPEYLKVQAVIGSLTQQNGKDAVGGTLASQIATLKAGLLSSNAVADLIAQMETALREATANEIFSAAGTDYTAAIANPTCDGNDYYSMQGWTVSHSPNTGVSNAGQQYDGNATGRYLDTWLGGLKALLYNAHQTIRNLPNGTYTLKAMCRTSGDPGNEGTYLYTIADNDSVNGVQLAMVKRELCNITKDTQGQLKAADGTDSLLYAADSYGSIWEAAAIATNYGTNGSELDLAIYQTHTSVGYGWHYVEVPAVVKNHILTIGFTNDSTFTVGHKDTEGKDCVPFTGWWLSADNFSLTLTAAGNNDGWSPVTAVSTARALTDDLQVSVAGGRIITNVPCRVYNMAGQIVNNHGVLPGGCYIVKGLGKTAKVLVK
jgi:hypothetical protein